MHPDWLECYGGGRHDIRWRGAVMEKVEWNGRRAERWTYVCQRCPVVRVDIVHPRTLELYSRQYPHIEGYHAAPGEGRLPREDVRRELARRARADDWTP